MSSEGIRNDFIEQITGHHYREGWGDSYLVKFNLDLDSMWLPRSLMSTKSRSYSYLNATGSAESNLRWGILRTLYILGILYWMHWFGIFSTGPGDGVLRPGFGYLDWPRKALSELSVGVE